MSVWPLAWVYAHQGATPHGLNLLPNPREITFVSSVVAVHAQ
jgi:hypothetical protein